MSHPGASWLRALAGYIANATRCAFNVLAHGGNSAGAWHAGAVPHRGSEGPDTAAGLNVTQMLNDPLKCYLLWGIEPEYDIDNPARVMNTLAGAGKVISIAAYATGSLREISDVILPLAPFAESEGSMINLDGDTVSFSAAAKLKGDSRPGWKILRRLGGELGIQGFDQVDIGDVRAEMNETGRDDRSPAAEPDLPAVDYGNGLYRIGELPMYSVDALCRRSSSLQQTKQAQSMFLGLNPADAERLGLSEGATARVGQGEHTAEIDVNISARVPEGGAWLRSATCATRELGHAVAVVTVEVA
jgi:NADH-quinone oxidoreductase subunit G